MLRSDFREVVTSLLLLACLLAAPHALGGVTREADTVIREQAVATARLSYPGGSRALLIGNSEFRRGWPRLPGVDADLEQMRRSLLRQGFDAPQIRVERNLTSQQFSRVLSAFGVAEAAATGEAARRTRAVVYIAGHGTVRRDAVSGRPIGYLVPTDAPLPDANIAEFSRLAIPVSRLASDAVQMPDADVLYLLDSCYPGTALQVTPMTAFGPQDLVSPNVRVRQIIAAGTDQQEVSDDGAFTSRLLSGLDGLADLNRDGSITASELGIYVRLHLADRYSGRQTPVFGNLVIPGAGIGFGDMMFQAPAPTSIAASHGTTSGIGAAFRDCANCPEMVPLSWQVLGLNSPSSNTAPMRGLGLAVGKYELLFEEWDACFAEGGCRRWLPDRGIGRSRFPAFGMSRTDAEQYIQWLSKKTGQSYRLLDELEWQSAARGGAQVAAADRDEPLLGRVNCRNCNTIWDGRLAPAGQFSANDFGLHDMIGNLWELTSTCGRALPDCARVLVRGAAFTTRRGSVSASSRGVVPVTYADRNIGFRVARALAN